MSAMRTQVYFSPEQRRRLDARARRDGKTLAAVVREAVDAYVEPEPQRLDAALNDTFASLPELEVPPRREWDRGLG